MKKLIFIALVIIIIACEEKARYWGCTDTITITYSDGRRDTTYRKLYITSAISKGEDGGITRTTTENIGNGVIKTTKIHTFCVKNPGAVNH